jgi:cytochrome c oxidase cbb3-type subunit III
MCSRFLEVGLIILALTLGGCNQKPASAVAGALTEGNRQSELQPGSTKTMARQVSNPFDGNEEAIAEGKRLYDQFNCSGCHAAGGGAIGPALMDDEWIYGSSSANIYWTVVEGRPNGMPAFGGRIVDKQIWQIAAFVRSLSDLQKKAPEPER